MSNQNTAIKGALAKQPEVQSIETMIQKASTELGKALPAHMSPERLVRIALTNIRINPDLSRCTPQSFMGSLFAAAQLGLEPGIAGRCYLIPFKNSRKQPNGEWKQISEVQLIVGFRGWIELFYRHDAAMSLDVQEVCEKDFFEYEHGTSPFLKHRPAKKDRGEVTDLYAVAKLRNGGTIFKVMTLEECLEHGKKHSKTWDKKTNKFYEASPWHKEQLAMCKKTVILQLAKLLPLSIETQHAIATDETSRDYREGIDSALDLPVTTEWNHASDEEAAAAQVKKPESIKPVVQTPAQTTPATEPNTDSMNFGNYK